MKRMLCFALLLIAAIVFSFSACSGSSETENNGDYHPMGSAYEYRIFGNIFFGRYEDDVQEIYYAYSEKSHMSYAKGTIEKYMHDGERYIAYHLTPGKVNDPPDGEPYYAILDTLTEETALFPDIESLSDAIRVRGLQFGNWFYAAHHDGVEGKRTLLFGDYSLEDMDNSYYGRSILYREQQIFYGILNHVRTDGERYIAFRERSVQNDAAWLFREIVTEDWRIWYDDPVTNAMLSEPAQERVGLYRKGFLQYIPVVWDKYVLWDTQENSVQEFDKQGQLDKYCKAQNIALQKEIAR